MGRGARSWTSDALTRGRQPPRRQRHGYANFWGFDGGDGGKRASVTYRFRADHVQGKKRAFLIDRPSRDFDVVVHWVSPCISLHGQFLRGDGSWPCENSSACRTRRNISTKLRIT